MPDIENEIENVEESAVPETLFASEDWCASIDWMVWQAPLPEQLTKDDENRGSEFFDEAKAMYAGAMRKNPSWLRDKTLKFETEVLGACPGSRRKRKSTTPADQDVVETEEQLADD